MQDLQHVMSKGYGMGKRAQQNKRIAKWNVSGYKFEGCVYENICEAHDYQDAARVSHVMPWLCLQATHGKEAMLADVDPCCVLVVCVCVCVNVKVVCACMAMCVCVRSGSGSSSVLCWCWCG